MKLQTFWQSGKKQENSDLVLPFTSSLPAKSTGNDRYVMTKVIPGQMLYSLGFISLVRDLCGKILPPFLRTVIYILYVMYACILFVPFISVDTHSIMRAFPIVTTAYFILSKWLESGPSAPEKNA